MEYTKQATARDVERRKDAVTSRERELRTQVMERQRRTEEAREQYERELQEQECVLVHSCVCVCMCVGTCWSVTSSLFVLVPLEEPTHVGMSSFSLSLGLCREMERAYDELMRAEREAITARGHQPQVRT